MYTSTNDGKSNKIKAIYSFTTHVQTNFLYNNKGK